MKVSILVPSRGRPEKARLMKESAVSLMPDCEVLFYLNDDDPRLDEYDDGFVGPDQPTSASWNYLAEKASGDYLMLGADDILFRHSVEVDGPKIALHSFNDGRAKVGHPHPMVTRDWYETLGYFVYPEFHHWYVDTWNVDMAERLGRLVYHPEIEVEHMTFKEGKSEYDDTYKRIRRGGINQRDSQIFQAHADIRAQHIEALRCAF